MSADIPLVLCKTTKLKQPLLNNLGNSEIKVIEVNNYQNFNLAQTDLARHHHTLHNEWR